MTSTTFSTTRGLTQVLDPEDDYYADAFEDQ